MKPIEICLPAITEHDKVEIEKFQRFLARRKQHPEETDHQAYAEVYGEVVFEKETA